MAHVCALKVIVQKTATTADSAAHDPKPTPPAPFFFFFFVKSGEIFVKLIGTKETRVLG
jgi:hypothetical protein